MTLRHLPLLAGLLMLPIGSTFATADKAGLAQQPVQGQTQAPPQGQGQQGAQGQGGRGQRQGQGQARDRAQLPEGTASISGRVLTADTGRPVKRARVTVSGGGRGQRKRPRTIRGAIRSASWAPAITP